MKYTSTKDGRESDSNDSFNSYSSTKQGNLMKRLLMLLTITFFVMFAGVQSTPISIASGGCALVCGEPFIDPNDGQCYQMCCPENEECKRPCELRACRK